MPEETKDVFTEDGWFDGRLSDLMMNTISTLQAAKYDCNRRWKKCIRGDRNAFQLVTDIEQITVKGYIVDGNKIRRD